ncbi:general substrate transporter [Gautieria morchelliformis]|nr:general substrate transporter [Gautieria morchelliformis]
MAKAGFFQNIHVYFIAFTAYWGIFLFGYDTGIAGGVVTQKIFQNAFNVSKSQVNTVSSNVVSVLQAGAFFGALGSAPISSWLGRRWCNIIFSVVFAIGAILQTVAGGSRGLGYIYAGRVISGLGIGAISAVAPAYVAECSPKEVRGRITGMFQVLVATGVMISYFVNYGVSLHVKSGPGIWRIPFGFQLVPAGIMCFGLLFATESPRWLAQKGRTVEALNNLARLRRLPPDHEDVRLEMAEIEASIEEELAARQGLGLKEAFIGKGNGIRFAIAFGIFTLQQWSGQNSVGYYAPQIFQAIGYSSTSASLLASGVYGAVKVVATLIFVYFLVERAGRKWSLVLSGLWMGILFFMIGAILKTHPPIVGPSVSKPSQAMAGLLYIYVVAYSWGWGPVPWIYCADIFPNRTRHYGLAFASAVQWFWNFVVSKETLTIETNLQWKFFMMFATINVGGMAVFSLFLPETKGRSLEEMDVIFGAVSREARLADINKAVNALGGHDDAATSTISSTGVHSHPPSEERVRSFDKRILVDEHTAPPDEKV